MSLTGHNMRRRLAYKRARSKPEMQVVAEEPKVIDEEQPEEKVADEKPIEDMSKPELVEKYDFLKMSMSKSEMLEKVEAFIEGR